MDPFAVLGMPPIIDLCPVELETAYLKRSRNYHPDLNPGKDAAERTQILERAAQLNDAYRLLKDRWERIRTVLEQNDAGVIERKKNLCPVFLMEAMELSETVAEADAETIPRLINEARVRVEGYFDSIKHLLAEERWEDAAEKLHESRYYRKTLQILESSR